MIRLTSKQIAHLDELRADKESYDRTLKIALNYHSNTCNELKKRELEYWDEIADIHGLDLTKQRYKIAHKDGFVCVVECDEEDMDE